VILSCILVTRHEHVRAVVVVVVAAAAVVAAVVAAAAAAVAVVIVVVVVVVRFHWTKLFTCMYESFYAFLYSICTFAQ
jgi:hypothetical protein